MERHARFARRLAALALLPLLASACGGDSSPTTPTPTTYTLSVQVRDEAQGAVSGALVRITDGSNAGRNATSDTTGLATISGLTAGSFTIEVSRSGYSTTTQAVTLSASQSVSVSLKLTPNTPPVIASLVARGPLSNEPDNYAEVGQGVTVTATVTDAETAPANMTYEWSATAGSFSGMGSSVTWTAPTAATTATLTVKVTESYGPDNSLKNTVSSSVTVAVHDGKDESGDLCTLFLKDFSDSSVSAETAVRNFSGSLCPEGKEEEYTQIADNRVKYTITYSKIGPPTVGLNFDGTCGWGRPGDACIQMTCEWISTVKATGVSEHVKGECRLTTVYDPERDAWKLCWSNFSGTTVSSAWTFR